MVGAHTESSLPGHVGSEENIARSILSSRHIRRESKVLFKAFDPPRNRDRPNERLRDISVDRFDFLTEARAVQLGETRAERRNLNFYGWAMIRVGDIRGCGRDVVASPMEGNSCHANIVLPQSTAANDVERKDHLMILAERSKWRRKPDGIYD